MIRYGKKLLIMISNLQSLSADEAELYRNPFNKRNCSAQNSLCYGFVALRSLKQNTLAIVI